MTTPTATWVIAAAGDAALWSIPVASAIISLVSLVYVAIGVRRSADAAHVAHLESELTDARHELEVVDRRLGECEKDRERLRDEVTRMGQREVELMRLVVNLERRGTET